MFALHVQEEKGNKEDNRAMTIVEDLKIHFTIIQYNVLHCENDFPFVDIVSHSLMGLLHFIKGVVFVHHWLQLAGGEQGQHLFKEL